MRLDFTFRFDDITGKGDLGPVRATSQGTITIRATGETQPARLRQLIVSGTHGGHWKITQYMYQQLSEQSRGLLRYLASPPPGFGHVPHPIAVAGHDAAPR